MPDNPVVSVVIGSHNRLEFLQPTVESVRHELDGVEHEIVVVDGGSSDGSVRWLLRQKDVITIVQHNRGQWRGRQIERKSWGYFMNLGFKAAQGRYVCMLSDDSLVVPGAIRNGIDVFDASLAAGEKVGAVAFYWRDWNGKADYRVGLTWGSNMFVNFGLYSSDALAEIGYADEDTYFFDYADGDIGLRLAEANYACIDSPDSYVVHHKHVDERVKPSNRERAALDWDAYAKRWGHLGEARQDWIEKVFSDPHETAKTYWRDADAHRGRRVPRRSRARHAVAMAAAAGALFLIFGLLPEALGDWPYNPFGEDSRAQHEDAPPRS
jgi:GT2 family glycosyltransferase